MLVHLRGRVVREEKSKLTPEALAMKGMAAAFGSRRRYEAAQRLARLGRGPLAKAALPGWTRDARPPGAAQGDVPRLVEAPRPAPPAPTREGRRRAAARRRRVSAKADILARVRAALGPAPVAPEIPRDVPRRRLAPARRHRRPLLRDASPSTARPSTAPPTSPPPCARSSATASASASRRASADLGIAVIEDHDLSVAELDTLDAVVTGCALAIADTGTIVLDSGPTSGRRALTLVPDHHVCIVAASDVVPSVPDAVAALEAADAPDHLRLRPVAPPRTSSSTASRASTARACST